MSQMLQKLTVTLLINLISRNPECDTG